MNDLISAEKKFLDSLIPSLRGYHLMLVGNQRPLDWIPKNQLHNFSVSPKNGSSVLSHYETLPIRNNSIDVAFLPYELNIQKASSEILLQELHRCLISRGKLFIFARLGWHPLNWLTDSVFCDPIFKIKSLLKKTDFDFRKIHWLHYGSAVIIEAQKNTPGLTPIKPQWEKELLLDKEWQPTPTAREIHD